MITTLTNIKRLSEEDILRMNGREMRGIYKQLFGKGSISSLAKEFLCTRQSITRVTNDGNTDHAIYKEMIMRIVKKLQNA